MLFGRVAGMVTKNTCFSVLGLPPDGMDEIRRDSRVAQKKKEARIVIAGFGKTEIQRPQRGFAA